MSIIYNNTEIQKLIYNGTEIKDGYYGNTKVFTSAYKWNKYNVLSDVPLIMKTDYGQSYIRSGHILATNVTKTPGWFRVNSSGSIDLYTAPVGATGWMPQGGWDNGRVQSCECRSLIYCRKNSSSTYTAIVYELGSSYTYSRGGTFYGTVESTNRNAYPDNGTPDNNYWYVFQN